MPPDMVVRSHLDPTTDAGVRMRAGLYVDNRTCRMIGVVFRGDNSSAEFNRREDLSKLWILEESSAQRFSVGFLKMSAVFNIRSYMHCSLTYVKVVVSCTRGVSSETMILSMPAYRVGPCGRKSRMSTSTHLPRLPSPSRYLN